MKFIDNEGITDPRINLAIEQFALSSMDLNKEDTYLLFYINEPSIIIGKNQNTIEEINVNYVESNDIHVVRRISGGGAVYHDFGNLNFSFLTKDDGSSFHNFKKFTRPVIEALNDLGVPAELSGRNDIQAGGKKISGNAQFSSKSRMFSHGTLMFNSEIENVVSALNVKDEKIRSKGIKSIRSRVGNINEFLEEKLTMKEFKKHLLNHIFQSEEVPIYKLSSEDWIKIHAIAEERYKNWDWNYGKSPEFDIQRSKKFDAGIIDIRFNVNKGRIVECKIFGDFFGTKDVSELEKALSGIKCDSVHIQEALSAFEIKDYFGPVKQEYIVELLY
ncbi:lipoate--protein ligase [Alteribacillus sp. HJP-4]|uniref:lipoate--protein ligase n=1 Tax=Alteribacillus sp. HJP-4 TaxID=2775394 RepID=UPI0035CD2C85